MLTLVLVHKTLRYRVYPNPEQEARLLRWNDAMRFLWNLANEQRYLGLSRTDTRYFSAFDQSKELRELRAELPWLADVPHNVCAWGLNDLHKTWRRWFKRLSARPRWKRKGESFFSFTESHLDKWSLRNAAVRFPKLGDLRAVIHRPLEGKPKTCTIKRDGDQWFASIVCELEVTEPAPRTESVVAIDRGIVNALADSNGCLTPNPRFYKKALKKLAKAQRVVARRKKGSKRQKKAKIRVMRIHRKVRRQREHFLHVESSRLAKSHGVVVIEKLNVAGMIRGRLARHIADAGWSRFAEMLRYKLAWSGGALIEVPAHYSSQTCSSCGHVGTKSRRSQAEFVCTSCGYVDHADLNAAKVLKSRANRSALPVEGTAPEAARRSGKRSRVAGYVTDSANRVDYKETWLTPPPDAGDRLAGSRASTGAERTQPRHP
jgi:putative transposase